MPGLTPDARQIINTITNQIRDQYGPESVLKELIQNADDAGAERLAIIGLPGLAGASNPLLRAPGMLVANDGPITNAQLDAMTRASGSDKANDVAKAGRFGLGQKSLFNLCDAFIVQGWLNEPSGAVEHRIVNPYVALDSDGTQTAALTWEEFGDDDRAALMEAFIAAGFAGRGVAIYIPFRSSFIRPSPGAGFSNSEPLVDETIASYCNTDRIAIVAAALRNLKSIEISAPGAARLVLTAEPGGVRLAGPSSAGGFSRDLGGTVIGSSFPTPVRYCGEERQLSDSVSAVFTGDGRWPATIDERHRRVPEKAAAHAAAIVARSPSASGATLNIHWAVFLPIDGAQPLQIALDDPSIGRLDLLLHGYFFVDSGRRSISFEPRPGDADQSFRAEWNAMVKRDGTLPLLPATILRAFNELGLTDRQKRVIAKALAGSAWWRAAARESSSVLALAECLSSEGEMAWSIAEQAALRPLPAQDLLPASALRRLFPGFQEWAALRGVVGTFDSTTVLTSVDFAWGDDELSDLLSELDVRALQRTEATEHFAAFLTASLRSGRHPRSGASLVALLRQALIADSPLANAQSIARVTEFMPQGSLFPLPRSVENRAILRALAAARATPLAVRSTFAPAAEVRSIDATTTIDWLTGLEDLLEMPGDVGDQANATVAAVIAAGPSLAELSENERARHLRVIRARRVGSDDYELLTLSELTELSASGRLFSSQPGDLLRKLAAAVPDVRLFVLRLTEESGAAGKLRLQSPSSIGAAAAILRAATMFGSVHERGNLLAELVRDDGVDKQVLRSLCVAEPLSAVTWLQLLSLGNLPAAFVDMTTEAIVSEPLRRIVPPAIADHLSNSSRERLGISDLGVELAVTTVVAAHSDGLLRARSDDEAQSILGSGLDWEVLQRLPIFRSARQGLVAVDAPLFRDGDFPVPSSMQQLVAVSDPWPDLVLRSIQARIPVWTASEQVAIALQQPEPTMFASEILDGVAMLDDRELLALRTSLRATAWIPSASGAALRGEDIISLDVTVDAELRAALPDAAFTPYDQLPALIRDHSAADRLRHHVFPSTAESLEALALQLDAEPDLIGCVVDPIGNLEDLRTLARRGADLALPGWPLLAALLRTVDDPASCHGIARSMSGSPSPSALAKHLNAVALHAGTGTLGEAAVRLHRAAFAARGLLLLDENLFVPCDVMLPSQSSVFRRADALAVSGHGLAPQHTLKTGYAETLRRTALEASRVDSPSPEIMIAGSDPDMVRANFARTLGALIEPWRRAVPSDAIVFVLGLLGRDRWMEALAAEWEADTRLGSYADIWDALDDALAPELGVDDLRTVLGQTLFTAHVVTESVEVQSAAGTICVVPLETDHASLVVGNPSGSRRRVVDASGTVWHHIDIAFVPRAPSGLQADRPLLEALIELICPTIMLALPGQKSIVSAAFSQSFSVAQVTIEHTIAKLRDQAPTLVRTLVLPEGGTVRRALTAFERASPVDPLAIAAAKECLWGELHVAGAADELLSAVRSKIGQMGYAPGRVLFELLQNADDAYVQMAVHDGGFRIQFDSSVEDAPTVDVVHWGRPINAPGVSAGATGDLGYQNDLYNMLAINHSEKPADSATTGKFGLGFKTVHMVTPNVRIASGFLGASIVGGMIPVEWPRGIEKVRALASGINTATLIELPIDLTRQEDITAAVAAFEACAEWLPAIASRIRSIEILRQGDDKFFSSTIEPLVRGSTDGISVILNGGSRSRRALRLDLGEGFSMIVAVGRSGPEAIVASSSIWNLVPLEEQSVTGWLINGPFDVDPGRSHIKGTPEQQADMFAGLGAHLGERLVDLFDHIALEPAAFATRLDMDEGSLGAFWARLATLFLPDLGRERELRLHNAGNGIGRLWRERPSVYTGLPAPFRELLCARDIRHRTAFALAVPTVFERVAAWPAMAAMSGSIVSEQVGDLLLRLAAATPTPLSLTELVRRQIGTERRVSVETARLLGATLTLSALETPDLLSERAWLLTELRSCFFLSKADSWIEVGRLAMESGGDDVEHSRAAFAPDANVLSATYTGSALEFFKAARSTSGFGPTAFISRAWADQAADPIKRTAFLRYLLRDSTLAAEIAARPVAWLPSPLTDLADHTLCAAWSTADVTLLLALLRQLPPYVPPPIEPEPPEPYEPANFLSAIHDWWTENRVAERDAYDQRTYPEGFDFTPLLLNDHTAWFTMFGLAIFQTLGRTQESQGRSFIEGALREGWWGDLAEFAQTEDVSPWLERLEAWSDPDAGDQTFLSWKRCFVDLYAVAKYLPQYIRLVRVLPRMIVDEGPIALQSLMRPFQSPIGMRMDISASSIDRSLGMGFNWLLRELVRHDVFDDVEKPAVEPYGWTASRRARRLLRQATIELGVPGRMDDSRIEFAEIVRAIGPAMALFEGDLDLPLQLISRLDYRAALIACLVDAGMDPGSLTMDYDDN